MAMSPDFYRRCRTASCPSESNSWSRDESESDRKRCERDAAADRLGNTARRRTAATFFAQFRFVRAARARPIRLAAAEAEGRHEPARLPAAVGAARWEDAADPAEILRIFSIHCLAFSSVGAATSRKALPTLMNRMNFWPSRVACGPSTS